jgi:hypothetical protein
MILQSQTYFRAAGRSIRPLQYVRTPRFSAVEINCNTDFFLRFQRVMHSVLATRILLHVREVLEDDVDPRRCTSQLLLQSKGVAEGPMVFVEQKQW